MGENKLPPSPGTCWRLCFLSFAISLCALWFILSCDPYSSALVEGYNCWLVCPLSNEGQQNPSLSCLLLCTSEAQSAPAAPSIPKKNRLPAMLCCKGRSLPRGTGEGEAESMMSCSWLSFPQRKKVQGQNNAPSQGFYKIPSTFGEGVNPATHRWVSQF